MESNCTTSDGSTERLPDDAIIEETDGGGLVFLEVMPGVKELLGFVDVSSVDVLSDELRMRGIDTGAVYDRVRFPTFERPEDCECMPSTNLPCWPCYRDKREKRL